MFPNRQDAAIQLADRLKRRKYKNPVVLGVPRGGIVPAAILANALNSDLDVLLARKIRAPCQPELAIGAIGEDGHVFLYHPEMVTKDYLERETKHQLDEIKHRRSLISEAAESVALKGRSVIVTDDGIATGSTLMAGLHVVRAQEPFEILVAVPVAPPNTLKRVQQHCDEIVCLHSPTDFWAIGQFYNDFRQVSDSEMLEILRDFKSSNQNKAMKKIGT